MHSHEPVGCQAKKTLSSKRKPKENIGLVSVVVSHQASKEEEEVEIFNAFFASVQATELGLLRPQR